MFAARDPPLLCPSPTPQRVARSPSQMLAASACVIVLLAAGAVHSPLDFEVSLGSSIEDDDADLDDPSTVLTVEISPK